VDSGPSDGLPDYETPEEMENIKDSGLSGLWLTVAQLEPGVAELQTRQSNYPKRETLT